ncbi:MAG: type II toxin-antitoxin system Phd/YefM family antitoxin [Gammaproteobacteria bacterium]|nr:type II toxin-antitoxin system Phd/YefM family antitoxin [Gammaproteobacteria bacterium]
MRKNTWQLQEAKSKFSQLIDKAMHDTPQFVTKHGKQAVVVLSYETYQTFVHPSNNLVEFFASSPLVGDSEKPLTFEREKDHPRPIDL